jgi:two-component system KDP operon response regulator KdpE
MSARKIMVVEDEGHISNVLSTLLCANGYDVSVATTGAEALSLAASIRPDLVLLDLGLPDMDGLHVLEKLRAWFANPILVVSVRDQENEKVAALDMGADDYVTKPFSAEELLARIRTGLKHGAGHQNAAVDKYSVGGFVIDFDKRRVIVEGEDVHLTQVEYRIVELLARNPGRVLSSSFIVNSIWGPSAMAHNNRLLRVNMANIRHKIEKNRLEPKYVLTEFRVGYRMADRKEE